MVCIQSFQFGLTTQSKIRRRRWTLSCPGVLCCTQHNATFFNYHPCIVSSTLLQRLWCAALMRGCPRWSSYRWGLLVRWHNGQAPLSPLTSVQLCYAVRMKNKNKLNPDEVRSSLEDPSESSNKPGVCIFFFYFFLISLSTKLFLGNKARDDGR